jgi:hypothetical protein
MADFLGGGNTVGHISASGWTWPNFESCFQGNRNLVRGDILKNLFSMLRFKLGQYWQVALKGSFSMVRPLIVLEKGNGFFGLHRAPPWVWVGGFGG